MGLFAHHITPRCKALASLSGSRPLILGFQFSFPQFGYAKEKELKGPSKYYLKMGDARW